MPILLNCDLGESYGQWTMGMDEAVMPYIDQANIACCFHAGDPVVLRQTLALAKRHDVCVGAHPAYPDLVGFGRRSMACSIEEIVALLHYQIAAIDGMAKSTGIEVQYVKPHGALYNDMMTNASVREAVMTAVAGYYRPIALMLQATPDVDQHIAEAKECNIDLLFEGFADRCYADDGTLLSRDEPKAVHSVEKMLQQVEQLCNESSVTTISGNILPLRIDSLCVHGDNLAAVDAIATIRQRMIKTMKK
ncbi:MAG: UPF0271 protein [Oceanicoccus sp.]|jgi:UPF0271 protein